MLVLSRKRDESIFIDNKIVVRVLSIHGNRVRLGIEAPMGIRVHRREVQEAIQTRDDAKRIQGDGGMR